MVTPSSGARDPGLPVDGQRGCGEGGAATDNNRLAHDDAFGGQGGDHGGAGGAGGSSPDKRWPSLGVAHDGHGVSRFAAAMVTASYRTRDILAAVVGFGVVGHSAPPRAPARGSRRGPGSGGPHADLLAGANPVRLEQQESGPTPVSVSLSMMMVFRFAATHGRGGSGDGRRNRRISASGRRRVWPSVSRADRTRRGGRRPEHRRRGGGSRTGWPAAECERRCSRPSHWP